MARLRAERRNWIGLEPWLLDHGDKPETSLEQAQRLPAATAPGPVVAPTAAEAQAANSKLIEVPRHLRWLFMRLW
jgi:hypothetical protein